MTAIVRLALARPYTFVVMAILIAIFGVRSALRTPTDIFPNIGIPVISRHMELYRPAAGRHGGPHRRDLRTLADRRPSMTSSISSRSRCPATASLRSSSSRREHQRRAGAGHIDIANRPEATSARHHPAVLAGLQRLERSDHPTGVVERHAFADGAQRSCHEFHQTRARDDPGRPVAISPTAAPPGRCRSTSTRTRCAPTASRRPTSATPSPRQNLITPVGTEKIGSYEYTIDLNDLPKAIEDFDNLPIKVVNGAVVFMRDVAYVHNGSPPQTNVVQSTAARAC